MQHVDDRHGEKLPYPQALFLAVILYYWISYREKKWLNWVMGTGFFIVMLLPALGLLVE
jgi:hypothetical protein